MERWLAGVALIVGKGEVDLGARGPVYVAIVHDGSGFTPGAAMAVDQNPYHDLSNQVLEEAFELLTDEVMKDEDYVKEIREEWGDRWEEILTEAFDGRVWSFEKPNEAAVAIRTDDTARKFIEIIQPEPER